MINYNSLYSGLNTNAQLVTPMSVYDLNEQSLFDYSLDILREANDNMRMILANAYVDQYVNEAASDLGFADVFKKVINTFTGAIEKVYQQFKLTMVKFFRIGGDDIFEKGEKILENYKEPIKFPFAIYSYTNLDADIPPVNLYKAFKEEFDNLYANVSEIAKKASDADSAAASLRGLQQDNKKDRKVANFRRLIVKEKDPVDSSMYPDKLYMVFRDGNLNGTRDITMTGKEVYNKYYLDYIKAKSDIKIVERDKKNIISGANDAYVAVRSQNVRSYKWKFEMTKDVEHAFDTLMKIEASTIFVYCQELVIAYGAKLDAIKENYKQNKKIIAYSLQQIIKGGEAL